MGEVIASPRTRRCPRCEKRKHVDQFRIVANRSGWKHVQPDGSVLFRYSYCHKCRNAVVSEYKRRPEARAREAERRRRRAADPAYVERKRAYERTPEAHAQQAERRRKKREELQRQPRKLARQREVWRLNGYEQRRKAGAKETTPNRNLELVPPEHDPELPAEPFVLWIKERLSVYGDEKLFASLVAIHPRQLLDYKKGRRKFVRLSVADRALTNEGTTHLSELWPFLYPDVDTSFARELKAA